MRSITARVSLGMNSSARLPSPLPPPPRPLERALPLVHPPLRLLALHPRLEPLCDFPLLRDFLAARPHAGGEARQIRRAESRGLENPRAHHRDAEQIRLELHEEVVGR